MRWVAYYAETHNDASAGGYAPKVPGRTAQGQRAQLAPPWVKSRPMIVLHAEGVRPIVPWAFTCCLGSKMVRTISFRWQYRLHQSRNN
jgi:hypothetical protein